MQLILQLLTLTLFQLLSLFSYILNPRLSPGVFYSLKNICSNKQNTTNHGGNFVPETKQCLHCKKKLVNKRSHSKHCSSSCRSRTWRILQAPPISVKVRLTRPEFNLLKAEADSLDLLINQLITNKALIASGCVSQ